MISKKTIAVAAAVMTLGMSVNTTAYADRDCGRFIGQGIHVLLVGLSAQAKVAANQGSGTTAATVNTVRLNRVRDRTVNILQRGLDKNGEANCAISQATVTTFSTVNLAPLAQGLADEYVSNPECNDGIDNEGAPDGDIDFPADAECTDAADDDETA